MLLYNNIKVSYATQSNCLGRGPIKKREVRDIFLHIDCSECVTRPLASTMPLTSDFISVYMCSYVFIKIT